VLLVILSGNGNPEGDYAGERGQPEVMPTSQPQPQAQPQPAVTTAQAATPAPAITAVPPPASGGR
ncbi:MAG TPA: hypothetical protein VNR40_07840, partial [Steroidobacter sp.]|nr:hypothetical protein [Steroidobacter sp.]